MIKSLLARALATASSIALGVAGSQALGQDIGDGADAPWVQVAAAVDDASEVGVTDVVQREAVGTLRDLIRYLQISDAIFFNETIETGPDSATRVSFLDDSSLSLGPSSRVVIDRFVYDPNQGTGEMAMSLSTGVFRFTSGVIDDSNYRISTPVSTIGIRGTEIDVSVTCRDVRVATARSYDVRQGEVVHGTEQGRRAPQARDGLCGSGFLQNRSQTFRCAPCAVYFGRGSSRRAAIQRGWSSLIVSASAGGVTWRLASAEQLVGGGARWPAATCGRPTCDLGVSAPFARSRTCTGRLACSVLPGRIGPGGQALLECLSGSSRRLGRRRSAPDLVRAGVDVDDRISPLLRPW